VIKSGCDGINNISNSSKNGLSRAYMRKTRSQFLKNPYENIVIKEDEEARRWTTKE
jgi:hypothetical protein